jgi:pimeloyl-ACP methyl ester carboxylesterase
MTTSKTRIAAFSLIALLIAAACVAALGAAYNALSLRHYRALAGVPGAIYRVGGADMHLWCSGHGAPAIILDAGLGDDSLIWAKVQPQLARHTTVCSYDRAGYGWSEPQPGRRDANAIAAQLHGLLGAAQIAPPYILMGHSFSGLAVRAYAQRHPGEVAGVVLVDAATPLQDDQLPKSLVAIQDEQRRGMPWDWLWVALGRYRLTGACTEVMPGFEPYAGWIKADTCAPAQVTAMEGELDALRASGEQTVRAGPFASIPVLILSRDTTVLPANWPVDVAKANAIVWDRMQEQSKRLSPHSRRIIAKGSDHYIHVDRAELLNKAVVEFVTDVRSHDLSRLDGATTVE